MTRIGTYGANTSFVSDLLDIQSRVNVEQVQVSSGLKSQSYDGISEDSNRLINFENEKAMAEKFQANNIIASTKLSAASTAVDSLQKTIKTFQDQLTTFSSSMGKNQQNTKQIQDFAFQAMLNMQSFLATSVNGQYIFSGAHTSTVPVNLGTTSLTTFQSTYNGITSNFPTTRAADLQALSLTSQQTTALTFDPPTGTITAARSDALKGVGTSSNIAVTSSASNNTTFPVRAHALTNAAGTPLAEGTTAVGAATISYGSTPTLLSTAAGGTGAITFAFTPDGAMTMTPANANTLANLTINTKFTVNGSGGWDGAFKVVSNVNGVVKIATDTDTGTDEAIASTALTVGKGIPVVAVPLTAGKLSIISSASAVSGLTSVTVTAAGADFGGFAVGNSVTLGGSQFHNGSYTVTGKTPTTVTFALNPDALRVSKFVPQTIPRNDVVLTYTNAAGNPVTVDNNVYGTLQFSPTGTVGERITATGLFQDNVGNPTPPVGTVINLASTTGVNDGVYEIVANNGGNIEVKSTLMTAEAKSATAQIDSSTWYKGDNLQIQHHVAQDRTVDIGVYASDPAFEKAFRALGLIAQGVYGTAGGLDKNPNRIGQAMFLLTDALKAPASGTPPFGPEVRSDIESVSQNIGFVSSIINDSTTSHQQFVAFLDDQIINMSQADKTTTITTLLSDSNALQASYQSFAKIQGLSLINFLK